MRALGGRRWPSVVALTVVIALLAAGLVLLLTGRGGRPPAPRTALPSPGPTRTPLLAAVGTAAPAPTSAGLQQALAGVLTDPALGRRVVLSVLDAATGQPLLERSADQGVVPASTAKIATAVAALAVLPPDRRFRTRVVAGAGPGDVVLVGGGDPTLSGANPLPGFARTARLRDLAARLRGTGVRRVLVDDGLFAGPRSGPGWKPGYVTGGDVTPVSALEVDGGRLAAGLHAGRTPDPALQAGRQLAGLLGVRTAVTRTTAVAGARELAAVQSPPLSELVETMLGRSDNDVAEALGRQVALERHLPATFAGEAEAVAAAVGELVPAAGFALRDASGLSPLDRVAPGSLTRLLAAVAPMPRYAALVAGLPVAGFDGTLQGRYRRGPAVAAAGSVRAKTGTLSGVSALAGLVRTRDGRLLAFDLTADGVPASGTRASQAALDRVAAVLAGCGCGPTAPAPTQGTLPASPPGGTPAT